MRREYNSPFFAAYSIEGGRTYHRHPHDPDEERHNGWPGISASKPSADVDLGYAHYDANQTTGDNFFGAVGGPADLFLIRDINGERQLEAIQTNGTATVFDTVDTNQAFVGSGDFNGDGLFDLLINVDNPPGVRTFLGLGELRVRNVAAQTRIISVAGIRLNPLKTCAAFQRDNLRRHF